MATTEPANNTTVPPSNTGTTPATSDSKSSEKKTPPTGVANTTPLPPTTTQPGETLVNHNIIGHELGAITHPKIGDGGVADSYANTAGSVELISVGIDKQFFGKLTYEVFDFYGEGAPVNPTRVFSGETSVVNWDESSQTGVIPINTIIPCKTDPTERDGSMDLHLVIKDPLRHPLYYNIDVPHPGAGGDTTPASGVVTTTTPEPTTTTSTTPGPPTIVQITKSEFDTILSDTKSTRVVIRGEGKSLGPNEYPLTIKEEDVSIKINYNEELSISTEGFNKLVTSGALIAVEKSILDSIKEEVRTGRYRGGTYVVYVSETLFETTTTADPGITTTTQSGGTNVYAGTTTTATTTVDPGTTTTTTPEPVTTTTTTSTTVAPLGTIDGGGSSGADDVTSTTPVYEPRVRFTWKDLASAAASAEEATGSTLSTEDQKTLDDLLDQAKEIKNTCPEGFERIGGVGDCVAVCPPGWERNAATGECQEPAGGDTTPPPANEVRSQKELLEALQTFSNIYIIQDFTVSDIINVPEGVTISGLREEGKKPPVITMSNTLVAFKITSSNVTLRDFTIQSANAGMQSKGIGVLVTRSSPDSVVSVTNVNISNISFRDIGAIKTPLYGSISVRGYNTTQSSPNTDDLIPVLDDKAKPFSNITIDNCIFNRAPNNAIDFWTVKGGKISNCTFNGAGGDGIKGVDLQDTAIEGCYLTETSQVGIRILGTKSSTVALNSNTIDKCYGISGIMIYYGVHEATVRGNQISNSNNGLLIRSACTSIVLDNNNTNNIKEAPLIISELSNNIEVINNTFANTLGSTVITILQSWSIELENNKIDTHLFEVGPGTAPKRGILISQSNGVTLAENTIDNSYPTTDEMSCPVYFYRIFPQNPTLSNGEEATPSNNPTDFDWIHYFKGTALTPGIIGGEAGLRYARKRITSGELLYNRKSGWSAVTKAWNVVPSFVSGNVDEDSKLIPYCIEGSARVDDGGEGGGVVIGGDDGDGDDGDGATDATTLPPDERTYTLIVTNASEKRIAVNGGALDLIRPTRAFVQDRNGFHIVVDFMDNQLPEGARLPLEIGTGNISSWDADQVFEQNEEPHAWGATIDIYIDTDNPSEDGNYRGEIIFSQSASVDGDGDGQGTGTTEDYDNGDGSTEDDTSSTTLFWPRIITVDPFRPDTLIDEYDKTPPPIWDMQTWLTGDGYTPPPNGHITLIQNGDDDNGDTFTTLFTPPTGCIEPPVPPINEPPEPPDPEIPSTTPPPNEQCVYPAPILALQSNFYRVEDILNLTTTVQPDAPELEDPAGIETDSEEYSTGDLVGEVVCDTNKDCNKLDY